MGALSDVTTNVNNLRKNSLGQAKSSGPLDDTSRRKNDRMPLRFMSPTISSQRATSKTRLSNDYTSKLTSGNVKANKRTNWMSSAIKRVSISRVNASTPDDGSHTKRPPAVSSIALMDKVCYMFLPNRSLQLEISFRKQTTGGSSYLNLVESRIPTPVHNTTLSPSDKPLPSPPVCQVVTSIEARGLIDAVEKPLKRSPPGKPEFVEEWPVLSPEKRAESKNSAKVVTTSAIPRLTTKAAMATFSGHLDSRDLHMDDDIFKPEPLARSNNLDHPTPTSIDQHITSTAMEEVIQHVYVPTIPYASTGGTRRPISVSSTFIQPRQTRTSKLRASLSSGNACHTGHTSLRTASATNSTSLDNAYENGAEYIGPVHTVPKILVRYGGPTQIVAGSHHPTRKTQRACKTDSRDLQPNISSPQNHTDNMSVAQQSHATSIDPRSNIKALGQSDISQDPPAILFPKLAVRADHKEDKFSDSISGTTTTSSSKSKSSPRNEFDIFEEPHDRAAPGVVGSMDTAASTSIQSTSDEVSALQTIFSTPRKTSLIKRLSKTAPAYGPTLRLSPSAERYIMGEDGRSKEKGRDFGVRGRDLRRAVVTKEVQNSRRDTGHALGQGQDHKRPLKSHGYALQSPSSIFYGSSEVRMKKTRCSEIDDSPLADRSQRNLGNKNGNVDGGRKTSTLIGKDLVFDVQPHCGDIQEGHSCGSFIQEQKQQPEAFSCLGNDEWKPPIVEHAHSVKISSANTVYLGSGLDSSQQQVTKPATTTATVQDCAVERTEGGNLILLHNTPARAEQPTHSNISSFPPRSSSRAAAPDYTARGSAEEPRASQSNLRRQVSNNSTHSTLRKKMLVQDIGSASSQLDLDSRLAKRGSITQSTANLQSGNAKGVLSNVRGFFHINKRSSDKNETVPSAVRVTTKQPNLRIASNGSPFPSLAEVHPLHRPTVSTTNKKGNTRRDIQSLVMTTPVTPMLQSRPPSKISETMALAMQILESARHETSSPEKERLLQLGKIMVDALTQARDAEKAMEEAKQAARKAEVSYLLCSKSVSDVTENVQKWRKELQKGI